MSEMHPNPPKEYQFETRLFSEGKKITDDFLLKAEWFGDGLSSNEFDRPFEELWQASGEMSRYVTYPGENMREVQAALYRGANFGHDVVDVLKQEIVPARVSLARCALEYLDDTLKLVYPKQRLLQDTADFLDTHPYADDVIATCLPHDDTATAYHHHARRGAAMAIMSSEEEYARLYAQMRVRNSL